MKKKMEPMHGDHVNVTPLIDIVMCLIIFFLICGDMAKEEMGGKVELPEATKGQELPEMRGRAVITIEPADASVADNPNMMAKYLFNGKQVDPNELQTALRSFVGENRDAKVLIRAQRSMPYKHMSPALVACIRAKVKSMHFSVAAEGTYGKS